MKVVFAFLFLALLLVGSEVRAATYRVKRAYPHGGPKAGLENVVQFSLYRGNSEVPLTGLDLKQEHEKLIHLMTLNSGHNGYLHEHPQETSPGVWQVTLKVGIAGDYRVWLQFLPVTESNTKLVSFDDSFLEYEGQKVPTAPLGTNVKLEATDGEYKVNLILPPEGLMQHANAVLKFEFRKGGKVIPVESLDNYLGAKMHLAGISGDKKDFMHSHPAHPLSSPQDEGPGNTVNGHFMQEGYYGLFLQFSHEKVLHTVSFGVSVKEM